MMGESREKKRSKRKVFTFVNTCEGDSSPSHKHDKPKLIQRRKALFIKHENQTNVPKSLQPFFNLWREYGGSKHLNENTKTFRYGVKYLKLLVQGKVFNGTFPHWSGRKFTLEEFETSLQSFHQAKQNNPDLKNISLNNFILNNFTKNKTSPFLEHLVLGPEKDPALTKHLITYYRNEVLGGIDFEPPGHVKDKFVKASNRLYEFFEKNRKSISIGFQLDRPRIIRWLFEAVQKSINGFEDATITPGHLCSDLTFEQRLPKFLVDQAIISDRHTII